MNYAFALNDWYARLFSLEKHSPGKTWWDAHAMHPAIFRALKIDKNEDGAIYAAAAFRLHKDDEGARILVAFPTPRILETGDDDWLSIHTVLSWNPVDDTAHVMSDPANKLVGAVPHDGALHIHSSPFQYLRALAEARAQWFAMRRSVRGDWHSVHEPDHTPGLLLLTSPDKVRWPIHSMPADVMVHGIDTKSFNNALLRQARIPRAIKG